MKKQVHSTIKAHVIRSACYVLLLLAVCVIPFALAQRNTTERSVTAQPHAANRLQRALNPDAALPATDESLLFHDFPSNRPAAQLPKASSGPGVRPILIKPIPKFPKVIIYDQLDNPGTISWVSQEFTDLPEFTAFLADDFFVPGGQSWQVTEVHAQGVYFNGFGPANNFNVFFYEDDGGLPGTLVSSRIAQPCRERGPLRNNPDRTDYTRFGHLLGLRAGPPALRSKWPVGLDGADGADQFPGSLAEPGRWIWFLPDLGR
jgi:hypothetical protein